MARLRGPRRYLLIILAAILVLTTGWLLLRPGLQRGPAVSSAPQPTPTATASGSTSAWTPDKVIVPSPSPTAPVITPPTEPTPRTPERLVTSGEFLEASRRFDEKVALAFVQELTAPEFAGRHGGSPENRAAAEYLARQFARFGLQPAGAEGFFQPVPLPYAEMTAIPSLIITRADGTTGDPLAFRRDYGQVWGGYAGGGSADGRVYWIGEGEAKDYQGLDISGELVFTRAQPNDEVIRLAIEHGAEGMLVLAEREQQITMRRTYRQAPYLPDTLPVLFVNQRVAERLLEGSAYTLSDLSILYQSAALAVTARVEMPMNEPGLQPGQNVLGVLPGIDPTLRNEVVILGAHYDHVGRDPNGAIYHGANDDASGVATLLEIARNWQEIGYAPDRTVLFAAWDGEEQGLLGARYYVEHPVYPLTQTVGMIQLDMVGLATDGVLTIDGLAESPGGRGSSNPVALQVQASAALIDVPVRSVNFGGGSDHAAFLEANVAASLLIWDNGEVPHYHTPQDTWDTLQPERLRQAGIIASHAAMVLATQAPQAAQTLSRQAQAIAAGDVAAFVSTFDPADAALQAYEAAWLQARSAEFRQHYTSTLQNVVIHDASATVTLAARADEDAPGIRLSGCPARLIRRAGEWFVTWPYAEPITTTHLSAQFLAPKQGAQDWLADLDAVYVQVAMLLGSSAPPDATLTVYPNTDAQQWFAVGNQATPYAPFPGSQVVVNAPFTPTAISLLLEAYGLPPGRGAWLRVGLSEWIKGQANPTERDNLRHTLMRRLSPETAILEVMRRPTEDLTPEETAAAYSLVELILRRDGLAGLKRFCATWGQADEEAAWAALETTQQAVAHNWEAAVRDPLIAARTGAEELATQLQRAAVKVDRAAFMACIAPADSFFVQEQSRWFDAMAAHPLEQYEVHLEVLEASPEGALAEMEINIYGVDGDALAAKQVMRLVPAAEGWRLVGPAWMTHSGRRVMLYTISPATIDSTELLYRAEGLYERLQEELGITGPETLRIQLYSTGGALRLAIGPATPTTTMAWYDPQGIIKLIQPTQAAEVEPLMAEQMTRLLLDQLGPVPGWLHEGLVAYLADTSSPLGVSGLKQVREAQRLGRLFSWEEMPAWETLPEPERILLRGQVCYFLHEMAAEFGAPSVGLLVRHVAAGSSLAQAFETATATSFAAWLPGWDRLLANGGTPEEEILLAKSLDVERILGTIRRLGAPEMAGRRAGSPQAARAARWIAEEMRSLGLRPGAPDGSYLERLPVSYGELTALPILTTRGRQGDMALRFPLDFREIVGGHAGGGNVDAELVWLPQGIQEGMDLGGRIAMLRESGPILTQAQQALAQGAGGLIVVVTHFSPHERHLFTDQVQDRTLPVVEITEETWRKILAEAGYLAYQANEAPPALLTGLRIHLYVPYQPAPPQDAFNVIGYLPGSRPNDQAIVLMAHYDGVGSLPDGTVYPGANKGVSGVATMLELARLWQQSGWEPGRPVYFIALGAEEVGGVGSRLYAKHPLLPTESTRLVWFLGPLGNARSYWLNVDATENDTELTQNLTLAGELLDRRVSLGHAEENEMATQLRDGHLPTAILFWPGARFVHTPEDTPESMEPTKLQIAGEVLVLVTTMLAR